MRAREDPIQNPFLVTAATTVTPVAVAVLPMRGRSDHCASASLRACPATDRWLMTATGALDTCTCARAAGAGRESCGPSTAAAATAADPAATDTAACTGWARAFPAAQAASA